MMRKNKKNFMVNIFTLWFLLCFCSCVHANSDVLVSEQRLYPNYIKTPQDIEDWLIADGFTYIPDKTNEDEWKTPEQTVKD